MPDRLVDAVEKAELAVASSSGVVSEHLLRPIVELLKTIRVRMSYPEDVLVVALAGGTGSGKSSLFNALVGEEVVDVGGIRPTTSEPAASVPSDAGSSLDGFLDHIGVRERHWHHGLSVCILDLPDTDSVEVAHRQSVDQMLPLVDAVVWVTDPEKYRDARLHHEYLAPLAEHSSRFIVALNQIDRLAPGQVESVVDDLGGALEEDGIPRRVLLPMAASPSAGPPIGLDELIDRLETMRSSRDVVSQKLIADLGATTRTLAEATGEDLDFDERAKTVVAEAAGHLRAGQPDQATTLLTGFLDEIAAETGGPAGQRIARLAADVPAHMSRIASEVKPESGHRWFRRSAHEPLDTAETESMLRSAVLRPVRAVLAKRAVALASIADLAVAVESLGRDLAR